MINGGVNMNAEELKIPLTIEKHLENYSKMDGHTDRHETLWHAWYQNKRWISQLLQITISSFPTYSKHDESHALSVLNNIEMILGQDRIRQLSATDCFVLLHTVYLHDIGMCITQQDRREIIENDLFIDMIEQLEVDGDELIKKSIKKLKCTNYDVENNKCENHNQYLKELYKAKLDVYYAIIELIANYRRTEHGNKSAERLYEWTMEPDKLRTGFSMAGVPLRIFLAIARSAQMHTCNNFDEIKKLPRKDGGYASDYYHPRFISVLLMLGDILDMDNDRFHPLVFDFVENFPETSKTHYDKHRAIRRLMISPDTIEIEADCHNQNALRLVRRECDMLSDVLRKAGYMWATICPEGFKGSLPCLGEVNLYLNGKKIPEELVTAQFTISQKKAFAILEGSNLYEGRFVFLREFLQNAIDASKLQYWKDYQGMFAYYKDELLETTPEKMNDRLSLANYPIEINMKLQKRNEHGKNEDISNDAIKLIKDGIRENCEYGVLVSIKDFGTGIDKESIIAISKVGNSRVKDKKEIQEMPEWLRPTAEFGVGLQSAFLLTGSFKCYTHTRSGEHYEITFSSGASARYEGYINVVPTEYFGGKYESYGTCFEVFVPLDKKFLHSESICTWSGTDPFDGEYENTRIIRHASELISQMTYYLDGMLGELLFPVYLNIEKQSMLELFLNTNKCNQIKKLCYIENKNQKIDNVAWVFRKRAEQDDYYYGETEFASYAFEYETARLYVWAKDINVFCALSGYNLIQSVEDFQNNKRSGKAGIAIYYKGIELQHQRMEDEIEIFEYIDIKGTLQRSFININRRGFTTEGEKFFAEQIYIKLLECVQEILQSMNKEKKALAKFLSKIRTKIVLSSGLKEGNNKICPKSEISHFAEQLVSLSFLSHLATKDINDEMSQFGNSCKREICEWQEIIEKVCQEIHSSKCFTILKSLKESSILFDIEGFREVNKQIQPITFTILDLFYYKNHYGILQIKDKRTGSWMNYIVMIEEDFYLLFEKRMLADFAKLENKEIEEEIDAWSERLLDNFAKDINVIGQYDKTYEQQFWINWLLKNIPVIGVFSTKDGNSRFNILAAKSFPYMYTNKYHKLLVFERIINIAEEKNINRFSTYAWQGWQYLGLEELPFSCFFVKRGYFSKLSLFKVIVPLEGKELRLIKEKINNVNQLEIVKNAEMLMDMLDFKVYFKNLLCKKTENINEIRIIKKAKQMGSDELLTSRALLVHEFFYDLLRIMEVDENLMAELQKDYFAKLVLKKEEWYNCYLKITEMYFNILDGKIPEEEIENLKESEIMRFILAGWKLVQGSMLNQITSYLEIEKLKNDYIERCDKDPFLKRKNKRMVDYIVQYGRYPVNEQQVENCVNAFTIELYELAEEIEKERLTSILQRIFHDK